MSHSGPIGVPDIGEWDPVPLDGAEAHSPVGTVRYWSSECDKQTDPTLRAFVAMKLVHQCALHGFYPPPSIVRWLGEALGAFAYQEDDRYFHQPEGDPQGLGQLLGVELLGTRDSPVLKARHDATLWARMHDVAVLVAHGASAPHACDLVAYRVDRAITNGIAPGQRAAAPETLYLKHWVKGGWSKRMPEESVLRSESHTLGGISEFLRKFPVCHALAIVKREIREKGFKIG